MKSDYRYRLLCHLGQGTYGVVAQALALNTCNIVAIKASSYGGVTDEEISILNYLCPSKFIVQILGYGKAKVDGCLLKQIKANSSLYEQHMNGSIKGNDNLYEPDCTDSSEVVYIAMECMGIDLKTFINKILHGRCEPQHSVIKRLMWQLCNGLGYCHNKGVAHRDLKPNNCLLSISENCDIQLKIADFGLAVMLKDRENGMMERSENKYVSLWYRAPELLMHHQSTYNCFAVDVWSVGCIFAEMAIGEPLFYGQCEEELLNVIFAHLREPFIVNNKFCLLAQHMGFSGMDLLGKMLELDPNKRISIQEALEHQYFSCFRSPPPPGFTSLAPNAQT